MGTEKVDRKWVMELLVANGWTGEGSHVRRVLLDMEVGKPAVLYVEMYGDAAMFAVKPALVGCELVTHEQG